MTGTFFNMITELDNQRYHLGDRRGITTLNMGIGGEILGMPITFCDESTKRGMLVSLNRRQLLLAYYLFVLRMSFR